MSAVTDPARSLIREARDLVAHVTKRLRTAEPLGREAVQEVRDELLSLQHAAAKLETVLLCRREEVRS